MVHRQRTYNPQIELQFSDALIDSGLQSLMKFSTSTAEETRNIFNSTCMDIMDLIAPFMTRHHKPTSEPWLNDTTHSVRRTCRRPVRKWKNNKLQVSLEILRNCLARYQKVCKNQIFLQACVQQ